MDRLTEKTNCGNSWCEDDIETDNYIPKSQFNSTTGKCIEKLGKLEDLEEKYGCPFEIIDKLIDQNQLYFQFYDELQHWTSIKVDLRKKVVWYCKQVGGHYACSQPLSNYGKTWWLKEDKSE